MRLGVLLRLLGPIAAVVVVACSSGPLGLPAPAPPPAVQAKLADPPAGPAGEAAAECEEALAADDWRAAVSVCERARAEAPEDPAIAGRLGRAYLSRGRAVLSRGDVQPALLWFERAREQQPDSREIAREYSLALAYRAGEVAQAQGNWAEALAKFEAVDQGDRLYLAWQPERSARRRLASVETEWGLALLAERALNEAEAHCRAALQWEPGLPSAEECLVAIAQARPPTPTPTRTRTPTPPPRR